jgi:hypothetical protein
MRRHSLKRLALFGGVGLALCSASAREPGKAVAAAAGPQDSGRIVVRIVSRDSTITARAGGKNGPVYSMQDKNGLTVVPAMTLQQLHAQRPEVARKVEAMSAVDTGAALAGTD